MKKIKSILFTHDDLDGAGCHIIFSVFMNMNSEFQNGTLKSSIETDDCVIVHCSNANIDHMVMWAVDKYQLNYETDVYFADIVPSREILDWIEPMFPNLYIFDHHRTNFFVTHIIPSAVIVPENTLGVSECGTSLLYKHFCHTNADMLTENRINTELLDQLVENVRLYDTWEWKSVGNIVPKKLQILLYLIGMGRFCQYYVTAIRTDLKRSDLISPEHSMFIDARIENEQQIINNIVAEYERDPDKSIIYPIDARGYHIALCITQTGANVGELASVFLEKHPEFDVYISFSIYENGELSFRTIRDDIDLGELFAKPLGGGGHPKAAGAPISHYIRCVLLDLLTSYIQGTLDSSLKGSD